MPRMIPLDSVAHRLAADLYGNPLSLEPFQTVLSRGNGSRPDHVGRRFRPNRQVDEQTVGGTSLSTAVAEQLSREERTQEVVKVVLPTLPDNDALLVKAVLLEGQTFQEVADTEKHRRQAVWQRFARICRQHLAIGELWEERKAR